MFDHLLTFETEDAAKAALPSYGSEVDGTWNWNESACLPNVAIVLSDAVWDYSDPESPVEVSPRETFPGWHIVVSLPQRSAELEGLPGNACRLVASRALMGTGEFLVYTAPDLDLGIVSSARIDPVFAGAEYPFGAAG
jgi:hypothetical protein